MYMYIYVWGVCVCVCVCVWREGVCVERESAFSLSTSVSMGDRFQDPCRYQNTRMLNPLCKMALYLHITYVYPPPYFKSSLDSF